MDSAEFVGLHDHREACVVLFVAGSRPESERMHLTTAHAGLHQTRDLGHLTLVVGVGCDRFDLGPQRRGAPSGGRGLDDRVTDGLGASAPTRFELRERAYRLVIEPH